MPVQYDLVLLVADKTIQAVIEALLQYRTSSLGIGSLEYKVLTHQYNDPGCARDAVGLLAIYLNVSRYAMVIFDRDGCGINDMSREEIEISVERALYSSGWEDRSKAIVIDPELENWIWSESPHVADAFGWKNPQQNMLQWAETNFEFTGNSCKPVDPKNCMISVLRETGKPFSMSIHSHIAKHASIAKCQDPAFHKLKETLAEWFSKE